MVGLLPGEHLEHNLSDLFRSFSSAHRPRQKDQWISIPGLGRSIPTRSGRAALVAAIKTLQLKSGARVGVPLYCCPVVFRAIEASGCKACFIDVDEKTYCLSIKDLAAKSKDCDAVIAVHMFGHLCNMSQIKAVVDRIPIIEDCAQSIGSRQSDRIAGSFGDISFFSFRSGKYLSVGEGGALYTSCSDLLDRAVRCIADMAVPTYTDEVAHIAKTYIKSVLHSKPLWGSLGYPLWNVFGKKLNVAEKSGVTVSQICKSDFAIVNRRFSSLDDAIRKQRAHAEYYLQNLDLNPEMLSQETPNMYLNRYHFPICFPTTKQRDAMAEYLFYRKVDTIKYVNEVVGIARKYYGYAGGCTVSEQLSKRVLVIPNYYTLSNKNVRHIVACLNDGWQKIR